MNSEKKKLSWPFGRLEVLARYEKSHDIVYEGHRGKEWGFISVAI